MIIKTASTKAITQPDFYFDKWFGSGFFWFGFFFLCNGVIIRKVLFYQYVTKSIPLPLKQVFQISNIYPVSSLI